MQGMSREEQLITAEKVGITGGTLDQLKKILRLSDLDGELIQMYESGREKGNVLRDLGKLKKGVLENKPDNSHIKVSIRT